MQTLFKIIVLITLVFSEILSYGQMYSHIVANETNVRNNENYNTFSGNVFYGEKLLQNGKVYLISNSIKSYSSEISCIVEDGNFKFRDLEFGKYSLYVIPELDFDFLYYPKYLPTYSGGAYLWEEASENVFNKNIENINISLYSYSEPFYGHCSISGKLFFNQGYSSTVNIPVPILLLNKDKVPMDFRIANEIDGTYNFEYLPEGKYYIHPEITGVKTHEYEVNVKDNSKSQRINFRISKNNIKPEEKEKVLKPIVDNNTIKIFFDEDQRTPIICELVDISGKSILKNVYLTNNIIINVSGVAAGIYLLRVRTFDNSIVKTAKVYLKNS